MPAKLVIKDATREQAFDLLPPAMVLGREPGCELQFLDVKLSRRHARFEATPQGIRLTDLGTTNGSFVNGQRITEVVLNHGDRIHMGNLEILFLNEPSTHDAATVVLPSIGTPATGASPPLPLEFHTMVLDSRKLQELSQQAPAPAGTPVMPSYAPASPVPTPAEGPRTVMFDPQRMQQMSQQAPPSPAPMGGADRGTQILASPPVGVERGAQILPGPHGGAVDGRGTVVLHGPPSGDARATAPLPAENADSLAPVMLQVQKKVTSHIRFPSMAWRTKFILLLILTLASLILIITVPLLIIQNKATTRVSLERGVTLANSLAAKNQFAIANNQPLQLDTRFVEHEAGVVQAVVMDTEGRVLAPAARSGETISNIEGIAVKPPQMKIFYDGVTASGDYNLVSPIKNDNAQTVGLAWITFTPVSLSQSANTIAIVIMLVIFLSIIVGTVLVYAATIMTVKPLANLADSTESVIKGDAFAVEELAGFAEVNVLAHSINRLIERGAVPSPAVATAPAAPAQPPPMAPAGAPAFFSGVTGMAGAVSESGELVVDGNFSIVRVSGQTEKWLGVRSQELLGKHVIEAIREQRLLEAILDLVNLLAAQPTATQEVDFSSEASLGGVFVLTGNKLPSGDQMTIRLSKKSN
jgi:hypothetical protein